MGSSTSRAWEASTRQRGKDGSSKPPRSPPPPAADPSTSKKRPQAPGHTRGIVNCFGAKKQVFHRGPARGTRVCRGPRWAWKHTLLVKPGRGTSQSPQLSLFRSPGLKEAVHSDGMLMQRLLGDLGLGLGLVAGLSLNPTSPGATLQPESVGSCGPQRKLLRHVFEHDLGLGHYEDSKRRNKKMSEH